MSVKQIPAITFAGAEIKTLGVKKLVSLDKEYQLVLRTADPAIMALDEFAPDVTFKITVEVEQ